jgi:hypothetical protein
MEIEALAWDRHKNVAGSTCSSNWTSNPPPYDNWVSKGNTDACMKKKTLTKIIKKCQNDNINMDILLAGSVNACS